ncbi:MAG TPA: acyl-ACP desaturase [Polyangiaceae bacterium]|nr:acyl-ACP desaturase [Polyangiaceae bacterium]
MNAPPLQGRLAIEDRLYRLYMEFFERAERERRWSVFDDIPWDQCNPEASEQLALCAETFASVEMFLPDYVAGGINSVRDYFGRAWWQANWGYEESKHSLALGEYLMRSGKRTREEWLLHQRKIFEGPQWKLPFETARQMTAYGMIQEQATFLIYCKHRDMAKAEGDECLRTIYDYVARDEVAHARFYLEVMKVLMEEDREGTLADIAHVFANFKMPGVDLVPDYDERILQMREAGIDRDVFIRKVYLPTLKLLGITRHDMLGAQRKAIEAKRRAQAANAAHHSAAE